MLKICSFLPAVTQMLYDMGLEEYLYGITFECPEQALQEKKVIVRCVLEGQAYTSNEIDVLFSKSVKEGESLYYVDEDALADIAPDIIFTQDICDVCQIDTECTAAATANLEKQPEIISISPASLEDVFESAIVIAKAIGREDLADVYINKLYKRIDIIVEKLLANKVSPKRVFLMEWVDPIYNCGHWIPHQMAYAGGIDMLSNPSGDSIVTSWEKIVKYDPEVLVIAPCGYNIERTEQDMHFLMCKPEWRKLTAVKNKMVFIADFDMFTQSSASTLVNGIELLAGLFHPTVIPMPERLKSRYKRFNGPIVVL